MSADGVLALMRAHRTIRRFAPTPVPDERVRAAVRAAQMASIPNLLPFFGLCVGEPAHEP